MFVRCVHCCSGDVLSAKHSMEEGRTRGTCCKCDVDEDGDAEVKNRVMFADTISETPEVKVRGSM